MRIKLFFLTFLFLFLVVSPVFAGDTPIQISPADNSTVSSSSLSWQEPSYPICKTKDTYRVQVDDDPVFPSSSIDKNTYTEKVYYSPQLALGTWYWRVMVRDETCDNWSNWSPVWSFNLIDAPPSPTPTPLPSPTQKPTPTPAPTHTTTPTRTPTPIPTPKKSTSPTNSPPPTLSPSPTSAPKNTPTPKPSSSKNEIDYHIASVAGAQTATPEAKVEVKAQKQFNPVVWIGLIFIFAGVSSIGYIYIKKNAKNYFPFRR